MWSGVLIVAFLLLGGLMLFVDQRRSMHKPVTLSRQEFI